MIDLVKRPWVHALAVLFNVGAVIVAIACADASRYSSEARACAVVLAVIAGLNVLLMLGGADAVTWLNLLWRRKAAEERAKLEEIERKRNSAA